MRTMRGLGQMSILAASLLVLSGSNSSAQEFKGSFLLPVEARWGKVDLKAGEYKILLTPASAVPQLQIQDKDGKRVLVVAMYREGGSDSDSNTLTLVNVDGKYFIRTLQAGDIGQVLTFRVPKAGMTELARSEQSEIHLRVTEPGK